MNHISEEIALRLLSSKDSEFISNKMSSNLLDSCLNNTNKQYSDLEIQRQTEKYTEFEQPIAIAVALSLFVESPDPKKLPQPQKFLNLNQLSNPSSVNSSINSSTISDMSREIEHKTDSEIKKKDIEHKKIFFEELEQYNNMFKISYKEDEKKLNENSILKMKIYEYLKKYKDLIYQPDIIENIVVLNCDKTQLTYRILVNFRYGFKSEIFYLAKKKYVKDQEKYHTKLCTKYDQTFGTGCNYGIKCQFAHLCKRCYDDTLIFY